MALKSISVKSALVSISPVPPIIKSAIILTSLCFNISIFAPIRPSLYATFIPTHGLSYLSDISLQLITDTLGVVMFTF